MLFCVWLLQINVRSCGMICLCVCACVCVAIVYSKVKHWDFLVVQWLRLQAPNVGSPGWNPRQRTRSHTLHWRLKILRLILGPGTAKSIEINILKLTTALHHHSEQIETVFYLLPLLNITLCMPAYPLYLQMPPFVPKVSFAFISCRMLSRINIWHIRNNIDFDGQTPGWKPPSLVW